MYSQDTSDGNVRGWTGDPGPQGHIVLKDMGDHYMISTQRWPHWYVYMQNNDPGNVRTWDGDPGPQGHWIIKENTLEPGTYRLSTKEWQSHHLYMQNKDDGNCRGWKHDPGEQGWWTFKPLDAVPEQDWSKSDITIQTLLAGFKEQFARAEKRIAGLEERLADMDASLASKDEALALLRSDLDRHDAGICPELSEVEVQVLAGSMPNIAVCSMQATHSYAAQMLHVAESEAAGDDDGSQWKHIKIVCPGIPEEHIHIGEIQDGVRVCISASLNEHLEVVKANASQPTYQKDFQYQHANGLWRLRDGHYENGVLFLDLALEPKFKLGKKLGKSSRALLVRGDVDIGPETHSNADSLSQVSPNDHSTLLALDAQSNATGDSWHHFDDAGSSR